MGGEVSDRQWRDVLGVLKVQGERLDVVYIRRWATALGVAGLLEKALTAASCKCPAGAADTVGRRVKEAEE